jgi:hypothetical protein
MKFNKIIVPLEERPSPPLSLRGTKQSPGYETAAFSGSVAKGLLQAKKGESPFALAMTA